MADLNAVIQQLKDNKNSTDDVRDEVAGLRKQFALFLSRDKSSKLKDLETQREARFGKPGRYKVTEKKEVGFSKGLGLGGIAGILASGGLALGAIGLGIGGFFAGIAAGSAGVDYLNTDGQKLKNLMINVGEGLKGIAPALNELDASTWTALLGSALFTVLSGPIGQIKTATGLTALGFGIGGFFAGLAAGDGAIKGMEDYLGSQITGSNLKDMMTSMGEALNAFTLTKDQAVQLGTLMAATGVAAFFAPKKTLLGIGALGAGLGIFFTALATADASMAWLSQENATATGASLATMMENLSIALGNFSLTEAQATALGAVAATSLFVPGKTVIGMSALGAGIAGFFTSLAIGDWASEKLGTGIGLRFIMENLAAGLKAFDTTHLTALGGLLGAGAIFGLVAGPAGAGGTIIGMSAIGLGIGGFLAGIAAGDALIKLLSSEGSDPGVGIKNLLVNTAKGVKEFTTIDYDALKGSAAGLSQLGIGLTAFFGGTAAGSLIDTVSSFAEGVETAFFKGFNFLFGTSFGENDKTLFEKIISDIEPLSAGSSNLQSAADGLSTLTGALDKFYDSFAKIGNATLGDNFAKNVGKMLRDIGRVLSAIGDGVNGKNNLLAGGIWDNPTSWGGLSDNVDFGKGLMNITDADIRALAEGSTKIINAIYGSMENIPGGPNSTSNGSLDRLTGVLDKFIENISGGPSSIPMNMPIPLPVNIVSMPPVQIAGSNSALPVNIVDGSNNSVTQTQVNPMSFPGNTDTVNPNDPNLKKTGPR
jgi:hypothetical protein